MDQNLIEAIPVPAVLISDDDALRSANFAFRSLFPQAEIGRSYLTVVRQPNLVSLIDDIRNGTSSGAVEVLFRGQTEGEFRATGSSVGKRDVLICLQDMNETAWAIQMRRNFVADLGHELKTPLTSISGILETCAGDPGALTQFLPLLTGEVDRMKLLIEDLQTLSKVEGNKRRAPIQNINVQEVAQEACARLSVLAKKADVRIELSMPDDPLHCPGDADEIVRAISNLVENGIRYGKSGGVVKVDCHLSRSPAESDCIVIEVSDNGPGVESHHIPRLTERFYRVDSHRSRNSGGSGLGLAIVKHIVNRHRGRMTIESKFEHGTLVKLMLPLSQSDD